MHAHLVHAHPEPGSFVSAMKETMVETFREQGHGVTVSDLYAMGFNPVASGADFGDRGSADHLAYAVGQRQAYRRGTLAKEIEREVERVLAADLLAFTFPVFWFSLPAMLKGWIDRVFLSGPFYGGRRIYDRGGLSGKRAFVACSLGGRRKMFGPQAIHGDLEDGMLRHFFQGTLGYVGLAVHQPFIAYHVPYVDDAARRQMLAGLRDCIQSLDERPFLPMPCLDNYDDRLLPREPR